MLSPAWTTDWITDEGRAKLEAYGVAPPPGAAGTGPVALVARRCAARSAAASTPASPAGSARPPARRSGSAARAGSRSTASSRSDAGATLHPLRVAAIDELTDDSVAITFDVPARPAPTTTPSRTASTSRSAGGDDVRRSYSICTPPSSRHAADRREATARRRVQRGRRRRGCGVGDELEVMTPAGRFTTELDPTARKRYVAIAAGSGITPVLSIVAAVLEGEPGSSVTLVYANRTQRSVMFLDEVHDLKDRFPERLQIVHVLSRETQDVELFSGRLDADAAARDPRRAGARPTTSTSGSCAARSRWWSSCGARSRTRARRRAASTPSSSTPTRCRGRRSRPSSGAERRRPRDHPPRRPQLRARPAPRRRARARGGAARPLGPAVRLQGRGVRHLPGQGSSRARVAMDANWALEPDEIERGYVLTCQSHPTVRAGRARLRRVSRRVGATWTRGRLHGDSQPRQAAA